MTKQGWRSAAVVIGACCLWGRAGAEPNAPDQSPPAASATVVSDKQQGQCGASTSAASDECDALFRRMMEYQKAANKEAREDRRTSGQDARRALGGKAARLKTDNQSVEQQMQESQERAAAVQQPDGQAPVATRSVAGVAGAKPAGDTGTTSDLCRLPGTDC